MRKTDKAKNMNINKSSIVRFLLVTLMAAAVAACGFHLRGSVTLPTEMQQTYVSGLGPYDAFGREIRQALKGNGVTVVDAASDATAELRIIQNQVERRVLSVRATGKVQEYELLHKLVFSVVASDGRTLIDPQSLEVRRDYLYDPNDPLGKSGEQTAIQNEMRRDLLQLMMLRLQARGAR